MHHSGIFVPRERGSMFLRHCKRSEAIHAAASGDMDCFVASLLAMTTEKLFDTSIVTRMSEATSGKSPAYRFAHAGYALPSEKLLDD